MSPKTPEFDKALSKYYALQLQTRDHLTRTCKVTGAKFNLREQDFEWYKSSSLPLPAISPIERLRRKAAYQSTQFLFRVRSAASGEMIVTTYPENTPYKIYEHELWYSDSWDPLSYGIEYDQKLSFFEQFHKLQLAVPRPNLVSDSTNVRSDYTNTSTYLKDCYLTFDSTKGEYLYYFTCCRDNRHCVDCEALWNCSYCYDCQEVHDSSKCICLKESRSCIESAFLINCRNCTNCFMCSNLHNKKYCFRNEQLTGDEYKSILEKINLGDWQEFSAYKTEWASLYDSSPRRANYLVNAVNCYGDRIENSKDCYAVIMCYKSDNVNYSVGFENYRDSYDIIGGFGGERCYELSSISTANNYGLKCCSQLNECRDTEYSELCRNCTNCFGCIGLRNKSFCILNKQYGEANYWPLVDEIKTSMLRSGVYGEFFPPELSPVPYQISIACAYPGLRDLGAAKLYGFDVQNVENCESVDPSLAIKSSALPMSIKDVSDEILQKVIFDELNNKYFRLTKYELEFYKNMNVPLPREHPLVRIGKFREAYDINLDFHASKCSNCGTEIMIIPSQEKFKTLYCNPCYQNLMY